MNVFQTREEADSWIASQAGEYFKPADYYVSSFKY